MQPHPLVSLSKPTPAQTGKPPPSPRRNNTSSSEAKARKVGEVPSFALPAIEIYARSDILDDLRKRKEYGMPNNESLPVVSTAVEVRRSFSSIVDAMASPEKGSSSRVISTSTNSGPAVSTAQLVQEEQQHVAQEQSPLAKAMPDESSLPGMNSIEAVPQSQGIGPNKSDTGLVTEQVESCALPPDDESKEVLLEERAIPHADESREVLLEELDANAGIKPRRPKSLKR